MAINFADSCLINRMRYYIELSPDDESLLMELEKDEVSFRSRRRLNLSNYPTHLFIVKSGWLYSYTDLDEKRRQVLRIHYPGDVVGLTEIAMQEPFSEMRTVSDVVLCPFPKSRMDEIFIQSPRLTALIFSLGMLDQVVLLDRLKMMNRAHAANRVAHFFLEIKARLKVHTADPGNATFDMPLTQEVIGDAIGLTNVSISNAIRRLEADNLLSSERKTVTIHDEEKLKAMVDFQDRHFKIDTSWFPHK
ncbi:MAG: Transcriptional regulator, Crp/Fnr family [uncultured Thiotrichaceae bacterium]|uniref:Transcriptional regulator, Crp/Fnr family n=1 Tax=uncultured Thiotrichaceae bacterium TaxID=298394 RepID=A0A6S6SMS1_9GAMM|nr:MAG: Transcriptional regulator, Crp/Fnr family [uncultured Thiotrichaceae bacterium]